MRQDFIEQQQAEDAAADAGVHRWRRILGGGVVLALLASVSLVALFQLSPWSSVRVEHPDGEGALQSNWQHREGFDLGVSPTETQTDRFTFGLPLCSAGGASVMVQGVGPIESVGSGYRYLGAKVHVVHEGEDSIIGARDFPPPDVSVSDVPGAVVDITCAEASRRGARHHELLVGLERTNPAGGGWNGFYVDYRADGHDYRLRLESNIAICSATTDSPACAAYESSSLP